MIAHVVRDIAGVDVETFLDPSEAMARCWEIQFDLVLVDYLMPHMNGVEFTASLRASKGYRLVPIIMVTAQMERSIRRSAIEAGATDFVNKPFDALELAARVKNLLSLRKAQTDLANRAQWLAREVALATKHIADREEEVIWRLARAVEYRDGSTGEHVSRVATFCQLIAEGLEQSAEFCRTLYLAAPLHDIGKIATPDAVLNKPGRLSPEEMALMREHVLVGGEILADGTSDLIRMAELIARYHHERWDGTGYPHGLKGQEIPLPARIAAVADVFDALCSERPYKAAWPVDKAYAEIVANAGSHFDPACVAAFQLKWDEIAKVAQGAAAVVAA